MNNQNIELVIFKNAFTVTLISAINILGIDARVLGYFGLLMFFDYISGVLLAFKNRNFCVRLAIEGIIGKILLVMIPLALGALAKIQGYDPTEFMGYVLMALSIAQVYSFLGNVYEYRTGKKHKEVDLISLFIKEILTILKGLFDNIISKTKMYEQSKSNKENEGQND